MSVPVTVDGGVLLIRRYHSPVREWCWDVPAGSIEAGEDEAAAAARERTEELGGECYHLRWVAAFSASQGISSERSRVYLATAIAVGQSRREPTELLQVVAFPHQEVVRMVRAGEITDGQRALALLVCESYLRAGA